MENQIQLLFEKQKQSHHSLSMIKNVVLGLEPSKIPASFFDKIENISHEFNSARLSLEQIAFDTNADIDINNVNANRQQFEELYFNLIPLCMPPQPEPQTIEPKLMEPLPSLSQISALPKITVPSFDGNIKGYQNFIALFNALVHENVALTKAQRFQYLRTFLKGDALQIISSLPLTNENYDIAYQSIINRYANNRRLATFHIAEITNFQSPVKPSLESYQNFLSTHCNAVSALRQLDIDLADFLLFSLAYGNLDPHTRSMFENSLSVGKFPSYQELIDYVTDRLRSSELLELNPAFSAHTRPEVKPTFSSTSNSAHVIRKLRTLLAESRSAPNEHYRNRTISCLFCNSSEHAIYACPDFLALSIDARYKEIGRLKKCFACLGNHSRLSCRSTKTCRTCNSNQHNSLLHPINPQSSSSSQHPNASSTGTPQTQTYNANLNRTPSNQMSSASPSAPPFEDLTPIYSNPLSSLTCRSGAQTVLLGTAIVHVFDSSNTRINLRAVLDSGSEISIITSRAVQKLNLRQRNTSNQLLGISSQTSQVKGSVNLTVTSTLHPDARIHFEALVVPHIISDLPASCISQEIPQRFSHFTLADPNFAHSSNIDLLLGVDVYSDIVVNNDSSFIKGQPSALNTIFGWIILGKLDKLQNTPCSQSTSLLSTLESINATLQRFWESEEIHVPTLVNPNDAYCEQLFETTTSRRPDGRYIVTLPSKPDAPPLGTNRNSALKSYLHLEKRLAQQPDVHLEYHKFMLEYLQLQHMVPALAPSPYIIPHHCVFKTTSSTTKLRVVFNGSAPDNQSNTLNERLLPGPKLQKDLTSVLVSFRLPTYAICADLKMMYRQILVNENDRHLQHIFYRPSSDVPPQEYELCTLTYGLTPSAYLAQRTLLRLVEDEGSHYPLAANAIRNHCYVDDIVAGADSFNQAKDLISQLIQLFSLGRFELRKWSSNNPQLLEQFPQPLLENPLLFSDNTSSVKILGLKWNPSSDSFSYTVLPFEMTPTKRNILSYIARTFDPLGFITPVTFWIKYFLQRLWLSRLDWDSPLPADLSSAWTTFVSQLKLLETLRIPRHLGIATSGYRLIGFCDASEKGYAACIYLHLTCTSHTKVTLLKAKSRVAPVKTTTIPRLELCAAVLLSHLFESVLDALSGIEIIEVRLHSDASIVLAWLSTPPYSLKIYVAHRITQILAITTLDMWHHIPTASNPADLASRGVLPETLVQSELWWNGPASLRTSPNLWPAKAPITHSGVIPELRSSKPLLLNTKIDSAPMQLLERFSSYDRLLRVLAYILRFKNRLKMKTSNPNTLSLTTSELLQARNLCVKVTQQVYFSTEIRQLQRDELISTSLNSLSPFLDTSGLLRVGGRLLNSNLSFDTKHPFLLPKKCHLSDLICDHFHALALHSGPRTTQSLIMKQFWIISLRTLLRSRIHRCLRCHRFRAKPHQPLMADLPTNRITALRAFSAVGIDFAGPFATKVSKLRNAKTIKGYLCIFVCLATKAAHLEYVSELSTPAFLAAFDRFAARRGLPSDLYSDNGTNFVGAARRLKEIHQHLRTSTEPLISAFTSCQVHWHFNPPAAPNFGGLWEAAVKSAKLILYRLIGDKPLTFEEYATVFSRIEAILNSRPLYEFSPDPHEELTMLTPGHFLIGTALLQPPEEYLPEAITPKTRWIRLRQLVQQFWKEWSKNYLHTQTQRRKWSKLSAPLHLDQVVIMYGMDTHPLNWPLGKIIKLHPSVDGIPRVVTVRTRHGDYIRPANKLVSLPTN